MQLGLLEAEKIGFILDKAKSDKALASLLKYYSSNSNSEKVL
jgi:hypothetical protein